MSEYIRSIEITVRVDTNKQTFTHSIDTDSLDDALEQFRDEIEDLRWSM